MAIQCPCGASVEPGARFCGACGGAITAPPSPGRTVGGRYRILSKIGEGGMGAVFRAEQISLKREVALKVLRPELSADPGLVRRFNAEAEAAARLNHPNTITVYDFGQDSDGSLFIAMELISGTSLRAEVARGPIPALRTIAIAEQICASLADAHAHGVVHRDLKPDNVMISSRGREQDVVRVLDFGIAKLRDVQGDMTAMPMTQAGDLLGTPQYMAPEQIKGDKVDGRTDIYALGAMLYEMVTGQMVFVAPTLMGVLSKHLGDRPVPPAERRPDVAVPPALAEVIMAALEKPMTARPQSMDELGDRLRAVRSVLDWQGNPGPPMTPPGVYATGSLGGAPSGSVASQVPGLAPHAAAAVPSPMPVSGNIPSSVPGQAPRSRTALLIAAVVAIVLVGGAIAALAVVMSGGDDDTGEEPAPEPEPPAPAPQPTPPGPKHLSTDFSVEPSRNIYADDQAPDTAPHHTDPVPHHTDPVPHHTDPVPHHTDPVTHHTDPVPHHTDPPADTGHTEPKLVRVRSNGISVLCPDNLAKTTFASGLSCSGWVGDGVLMISVVSYPPVMAQNGTLNNSRDAAKMMRQKVIGTRTVPVDGAPRETVLTTVQNMSYELAVVVSHGHPVMIMLGATPAIFKRTAPLRRSVLRSIRIR